MTDNDRTDRVEVTQADRVALEDVTSEMARYFGNDLCLIWSGEHRLYWRANANGYTSVRERAGLYTLASAFAATKHCDPDKQIAFERVAALSGAGGEINGAGEDHLETLMDAAGTLSRLGDPNAASEVRKAAQALAALATHPGDHPGDAGEGYVLVPREPTPAMVEAWNDAYRRKRDDCHSPTPTEHPEDGGDPFGYGYRAMLAAFSSTFPPAGNGVRWRERWYGSAPERGSAIVDEAGKLVAYFGGDEATHAATTRAVAAHNASLSPTSAPAGDGAQQEAVDGLGMVSYGPAHADYPNPPKNWRGGEYRAADGRIYNFAKTTDFGGRDRFAVAAYTPALSTQATDREKVLVVAGLVGRWQPIATVDRVNGRRLILAWDDCPALSYHWEVGRWSSTLGWVNTYGKAFGAGEPTHWMEPEAPSEAGR